jgi:hypothetical protein
MKARILVVTLVLAGLCAFSGFSFAGSAVAQPNGPALSRDGRPEDWGGPGFGSSLAPMGRPTDWGSPSRSTLSTAGKPEDWGGVPARSSIATYGRPTDWEAVQHALVWSFFLLFVR